MDFFYSLLKRNELLFWFGLANFILALIFVVLSKVQTTEVAGVNAWYKPIKFALSIGILAWTMGWYIHHLHQETLASWYAWVYVAMMGFEIAYIAFQAYRGEQSHFNTQSSLYSALFAAMGIAATVVTLFTAYIGVLFFTKSLPDLPDYYLWAIRLGIIIFVVFALEGFVMGSRLQHTIGAADGGEGIPFLNWSSKYGDARIAHFIGMHALQVLPVLAFYLLKSVKLTFIVAFLYAILALYAMARALQAKPFVSIG